MQKAAPFRGGFLLEVQKIDGCVFVSVILGRLSGAFLLNCELFALTLLFALPLGLVVSFGSMSRCKPLSAAVKTFVWIIRGTPLMLQIIGIYLGPGGNNTGGIELRTYREPSHIEGFYLHGLQRLIVLLGQWPCHELLG